MATLEEWRDAARRAVPPLTGEVLLPGLSAPVLLLRDGLGVSHLRAATARDAFLAQGFAHAQDRLFQMELNRRRALGRSAEWLGPSAFAADALARRLGVEAASRRDAAALGGEAREMVEAYAAGANAFLASGAPLPLEYELLGAAPEPWEGLALHRSDAPPRPADGLGVVQAVARRRPAAGRRGDHPAALRRRRGRRADQASRRGGHPLARRPRGPRARPPRRCWKRPRRMRPVAAATTG
jgi:hypothetical protein